MPDLRDWAEHASTFEWGLAVLVSIAITYGLGWVIAKIASVFRSKQPGGRG